MPSFLESFYVKNRDMVPCKHYFGPLAMYKVALVFLAKKKRNLFFTITDLVGNVIYSIASSKLVDSKKKRFQKHTLELLLMNVVKILRKLRIAFIEVIFRVKKRFFFKVVLQYLAARRCIYTKVHFNYKVPFNGCRAKKLRRL